MLLFLAQAFLAKSLFSTGRAPDTAMVLSKHFQACRSLENLKAGNLGRAYLPNDARAKVFHGLGPGSSVTEAVLETVLKELDSYLVVDDYGSVECVKFARDEYNKRPVGDKWWGAKRRLTHASANRLYDHTSNYRIIHGY